MPNTQDRPRGISPRRQRFCEDPVQSMLSVIGSIRTRRRARQIGRVGLQVLFASAFLAPAVANAGLLLVTAAFPFAVADWRALLRQPVVLACSACAIYLIALTVVLRLAPPEAIDVHWNGLWAWLQLVLFIPVAFFVRADSAHLSRLLLLCVFGLIIGMLWRLDWAQLLRSPQVYLDTSRDGYGFPALGFALFSGTAVLGMVLLRRRWWAGSPARILLWVVCLLLPLQGFFVTQARGAWFSLLATAGFVFIISRRYRQRSVSLPQTRILRYAAVILALVVFAATQGRMIVSRLLEEVPAVQDIISWRQEYYSGGASVILRWNAQRFGLETWLQRPLTGWGPDTSHDLMVASGNPRFESKEGEGSKILRHLHNTYLELLVQTGVLGLVLAGVLVAALLRGLVQAFRAGRLAADLYLFLLSAFILMLLWSLFDYRAVHQDWRFYWLLLAGTTFSFSLLADNAADSEDAAAGKPE